MKTVQFRRLEPCDAVRGLPWRLVAFRLYAVKLLAYRLSPSQSRAMNEPCVLWNFFDVHDCWHFVSSAALFLHQLIMFLIDSDLSKVPRREIAAF